MEPTLRLRKISSRLGLVEVPAGCGVGESFLLGWMLSLNGQGASCHLHAYSEGVRSTAPASHIYSSIIWIEGTSEIGRTGNSTAAGTPLPAGRRPFVIWTK